MDTFLYNSTICRLCGEENDNGTLIYTCEENNQTLCDIINSYLPIKVSDDGQLPRTICPGCAIQLEATVEFITLIIKGQKIIRELYRREKVYKKSLLINSTEETEVISEKIIYEINTSDGVYQVEHPVALQVAGLEKPKRKRGRPPKKTKTPEEIAAEAAARERELQMKEKKTADDISGKRRRKTPTRFKEAVQGKELERIFKEEGVTDGEESDHDSKADLKLELMEPVVKEPEVIGHTETSGELVVVIKGKGRGRPKGPMRPTRQECAICGMEFSCVGRYMSHVAAHGPVLYQCAGCHQTFTTRPDFNQHQADTAHAGPNIVSGHTADQGAKDNNEGEIVQITENENVASNVATVGTNTEIVKDMPSLPQELPDLNPQPELFVDVGEDTTKEFISKLVTEKPGDPLEVIHTVDANENTTPVTESPNPPPNVVTINAVKEEPPQPSEKSKLKCNHCDKVFTTKQSKSLHIKASHEGERPYVCKICGASFPYPRSLALHHVSHRRENAPSNKGYACDLCGKVLNHPSSVVYHKEAEHAGQRYVCNKCGKTFKHKQLLKRHQLVHSQLRPWNCKTCNSSFKTKANLLNHQLLHSGVKKFSCEICKHRFAHKTSLTLHMRWHTGTKPYTCMVCGKSFSQKGNLSEHSRIHTGEKPYQCQLCPRRFTTSSQHRLHKRRHAAAAHVCAHCGKRFASRATWAAHVRREAGAGAGRARARAGGAGAGAGTHKCGVCGRGFSERLALRKHARTHTGERPFKCTHCPRAFADCSNLNKHRKQVHKQVSLLVNNGNQHRVEPPLHQHQPLHHQHQQQQQQVTIRELTHTPQLDHQLAIVEETDDNDLEERVIYVTYDVDDFQIMDPEQENSIDENKVLTTCELYSGPSLLVEAPELDELGHTVLKHEQLELQQEHIEHLQQEHIEHLQQEQLEHLQHEQLEQYEHVQLEELPEVLELDTQEHMPVTDEQGNPLHFTMQDGTRLAITSADGKSLQVITQDGQTIPVEINGYTDEEEIESPGTIVHQLNLQKSVESTASSPVTHYFAIV